MHRFYLLDKFKLLLSISLKESQEHLGIIDSHQNIFYILYY